MTLAQEEDFRIESFPATVVPTHRTTRCLSVCPSTSITSQTTARTNRPLFRLFSPVSPEGQNDDNPSRPSDSRRSLTTPTILGRQPFGFFFSLSLFLRELLAAQTGTGKTLLSAEAPENRSLSAGRGFSLQLHNYRHSGLSSSTRAWRGSLSIAPPPLPLSMAR